MNTFLDFEALLETHRVEAPQVLESFVRLAYTPVRQLAACLLADARWAAELTPIILQTALEQLSQYPVGTNFAVWLFALTVRVCRKHQFRERWRKGKHKDREVRPSAFGNLSEYVRVVLFLYGLDLEISDMAVILQRREGTLQKDLDEGLVRLGIAGTEEEVKPPLQAELAREYPTPSEPEEGFPALIERLTPRDTSRPARAGRFTRWTEWAWASVALIVLLGVFWTFSRTDRGDNMTLPMFPSPTPPLPEITQPQATNVSTQPDIDQNMPYATDPMISGDGKTVVYVSNDENGQNFYLYEQETGQATQIDLNPESSQSTNNFYLPDISHDGRRIVFIAWTLEGSSFPCPGNGAYICEPVVLYDRDLQTWTVVTINDMGSFANGSSSPAIISGDGRYVAFWTTADNLVPEPEDTCLADDYAPSCGDLFVKDLETGQIQRIAVGTTPNETVHTLSFSMHGEWLVYSLVNEDQTAQALTHADVFAVSLPDGEIHPVNVASDGTPGNGPSFQGVISGDGRFVAFVSAASNLVAGDTNGANDVFRHDLQTGETVRISVGVGGVQAEGHSGLYGGEAGWFRNLTISSDGQRVVFFSYAENLFTDEEAIWCVAGSIPVTCYGVFSYDQATRQTMQLNVHTGHEPNTNSLVLAPSLSSDGRWLTFQEILWYLSADCPSASCSDIYLYDLEEKTTVPVSHPKPVAEGEERWHFQTYLEGTTGWVNGVSYSPAGDLASADQDGNLLLLSPAEQDNAQTVATGSEPLHAVTFSTQGWLAAGGVHGNVCIYPLSADNHDRCLRDHPGQVRSLAFSPDGELLAVGTLGAVRIWRNVEGQFVHVREYPYPGGLVESVAFSPDGALLATAVDAEVWIRRVTTGEVIARLAGNYSDDVFDLAFSPDGQYLASGAEGHLAVLWQVVKSGDTWTFVYLHSFKHHDWPRALAFSPDSTVLAVGTFDSSIVLWHLPDGQYIDTLRRTTQEQVLDLAFSPDGRQIAAGTVHGVRVWAYGTEAGDESLSKYFSVTENEATVWTNNLYLIPKFNPRETTVVHTLEEAQALVSFPITTWKTPPEGFTLSEIYVFRKPETDLEAVSLSYLQTTSFQPSSLILTESKTNPLSFDFPISRDAQISATSVGLWPGEFVSGGWNIGNTITTPDGQPNYERFWDPELASLWLRWQEGNRYFALLYDQPYNLQNITETERF
ncbi:MAG: hypothetical protein HUU38_29020, partial [Anaerolineales bacterium]|nr:hypothetical protein [Anaerolineales bacterium]